MTSTNTGARGAWPPRASRPPTLAPNAEIRAWAELELAARLHGRSLDSIPVLGEPEWQAADRSLKLFALLPFAINHYEGTADITARLRRDAENDRVAYLARLHEAHDQANEAARADRYALARWPMLDELQARRRTYPPTREPIQTPNWPPVLIPGSGGRRLGEPNEGAA